MSLWRATADSELVGRKLEGRGGTSGAGALVGEVWLVELALNGH